MNIESQGEDKPPHTVSHVLQTQCEGVGKTPPKCLMLNQTAKRTEVEHSTRQKCLLSLFVSDNGAFQHLVEIKCCFAGYVTGSTHITCCNPIVKPMAHLSIHTFLITDQTFRLKTRCRLRCFKSN